MHNGHPCLAWADLLTHRCVSGASRRSGQNAGCVGLPPYASGAPPDTGRANRQTTLLMTVSRHLSFARPFAMTVSEWRRRTGRDSHSGGRWRLLAPLVVHSRPKLTLPGSPTPFLLCMWRSTRPTWRELARSGGRMWRWVTRPRNPRWLSRVSSLGRSRLDY
jgi:hypothetical protein